MNIYEHRVRFNEVDAQAIVFNSHYLTWCDHAIYEYFRSNGWSPTQLKNLQLDLVVRKVQIDYEKSAVLDDIVTFDLDIDRIGNSSLSVTFTLKVEAVKIVSVQITYVNVIDQKATAIPDEIRAYLLK